jgi:hypothetical protein
VRGILLALMVALAIIPPATAAGGRTSPRTVVAQARAEWWKEVRASAAHGDRATRFPSPPRTVLLRRLRLAAHLYGFRIVRVTMLHPLQRVPVIVVSSDRKLALARATPRIVELFDPHRATRANPSGYAYEAYFFEARDGRGVPYLATFNHWRAPHVGGGEWAASEDLFPFPHW